MKSKKDNIRHSSLCEHDKAVTANVAYRCICQLHAQNAIDNNTYCRWFEKFRAETGNVKVILVLDIHQLFLIRNLESASTNSLSPIVKKSLKTFSEHRTTGKTWMDALSFKINLARAA